MALDFPNSPALNQIYTGPNGVAWQWDGAKWLPGNTPTAYASTQYVDAAVGTALHDVGRNYIHNSMFNIQQRGLGPWTINGLTADRWAIYYNLGSSSISLNAFAVGTGVSFDEPGAYFLMNMFTGVSGAGAQNVLYQCIEDVRRLSAKTVTVSFWALAWAIPLKLGVNFTQNFGSGGSPSAGVAVAGQSVSLTTGWVKYSLTFVLPSVQGKTLGTNNNHNTQLNFWCSADTSFNAQTGSVGAQSGTIQLWGVQVELGTVATLLEKLDPVTQLQQCQRFYQSSWAGLGGYGTAGMTGNYILPLPVPLRAVGTYAVASPSYVNCSGATVGAFGSGANISVNITVTTVGQFSFYMNYTASADL